MFKNLTIRQISVSVSVFIWALQLVLITLIFLIVGGGKVNGTLIIIYALISLILGFIFISYLFERFVFRKIKLIYKMISRSKDSLEGTKSKEAVDTSIQDVNDEVLKWARQTKRELSTLKSLETYRRKYLGDISHELKTPIFTIQGYLHTLLDGGIYDENINKKFLKRAIKNLSRLETIVEDLELINQLEADPDLLDISTFDLKAVVEEVFNDLNKKAGEKNIELVFKQGADRTFMVKADKHRIQQVFVNLIGNSIKYGNENGITKVSFYDLDELVLTEVSDNGIGINEKDMNHLFDRFYRVDKSRSRKEGGSGLGLSIVKNIVEAHNQKITVRSTYGKGSTFGFTLTKA
ncbi:MAG: HAMP domain-containing histidine kinase [Bacteroidia bacterium]|nr:HAMP domain-containing histidine kinase [Bacteroidia bacterium]